MTRLVVVAILLTICWAARAPLLRTAARWLDVGEPPCKADYVLVLNGGEDTRPFAAAALVNAGWARRALIAKVAPLPNVTAGILPASDEINREVLVRCGVPDAKVTVLPGAAATTYDEARALAAFLLEHPATRVLVVTNDYHTRRSRWVFARVLAERATQISFVSAPSDEFPIDAWWRSPVGFQSIAAEYLKLAFYAVAYGHLIHWLAACAVLILVAAWIRRRESPSPDDVPRSGVSQ
jgi:uncharacterized SAM-binding protein YcdF (DUF218 family)